MYNIVIDARMSGNGELNETNAAALMAEWSQVVEMITDSEATEAQISRSISNSSSSVRRPHVYTYDMQLLVVALCVMLIRNCV
jgi:hypothetical protein